MTPADVFDAISSGNMDKVQALVAGDADVAAARNEQGVSAVMTALYHRRRDLADVLLGAAPPLDVFDTSALGATDQALQLVDADASLATAWSADGFTALHLAAFFGHSAVARGLVERGADVAAVSKNEMRVQPLHSAAARGSVELVTLLLEAGAPANVPQQGGYTALHAAAMHDKMEMARVLKWFGADPRQPTDDGKSSIDLAAAKGYDGMVALLKQELGS